MLMLVVVTRNVLSMCRDVLDTSDEIYNVHIHARAGEVRDPARGIFFCSTANIQI